MRLVGNLLVLAAVLVGLLLIGVQQARAKDDLPYSRFPQLTSRLTLDELRKFPLKAGDDLGIETHPLLKTKLGGYTVGVDYARVAGVEGWRPLVAAYFDPLCVDAALSVMAQESGGNPNNVNSKSGAAGLFQQMPQYWEARITRAEQVFGRSFSHNIFDPEANIAASAVLSGGGWNWSHWECKP